MTNVEQNIVRRLVEFLAARGWALDYKTPKTHEDVCSAVHATGLAWVRFRNGDTHGAVLLIEGNGEDIVSDWTLPAAGTFGADMDAFCDVLDADEAERAATRPA